MSPEYDLFSCFCLFDECLRSRYERDTYCQLIDRIYTTNTMAWIVKSAFKPHKIERTYVSCLEHCRRILENICLTPTQNEILVNNCLKIDFDENQMIHCYQFYKNEDMSINYFCHGCKEYFMSMSQGEFHFNRVVIQYGLYHCTH